jgi:hypothetical protein
MALAGITAALNLKKEVDRINRIKHLRDQQDAPETAFTNLVKTVSGANLFPISCYLVYFGLIRTFQVA